MSAHEEWIQRTMTQVIDQRAKCDEQYEQAADYCARMKIGDLELDDHAYWARLHWRTHEMIDSDPDAFKARVMDYAYGYAMQGVSDEQE